MSGGRPPWLDEELNAVETDITICPPGTSVAGVPILFQTLHLIIIVAFHMYHITYRSCALIVASAWYGR